MVSIKNIAILGLVAGGIIALVAFRKQIVGGLGAAGQTVGEGVGAFPAAAIAGFLDPFTKLADSIQKALGGIPSLVNPVTGAGSNLFPSFPPAYGDGTRQGENPNQFLGPDGNFYPYPVPGGQVVAPAVPLAPNPSTLIANVVNNPRDLVSASDLSNVAAGIVKAFNPNTQQDLINQALSNSKAYGDNVAAAALGTIEAASKLVNPISGSIGIFDLPNTPQIDYLPLSKDAYDYYVKLGVTPRQLI